MARKKASPDPTLDTGPAMPRDMVLPAKLRQARVDTRSLKSGVYQRKLLAWAAPELITELFNSIRRNLRLNNTQTQKLASEFFGFTAQPGKPSVSVLVNQQNTNTSESKAASFNPSRELSSPDEIYRKIAEDREQRNAVPRGSLPLQLEATPIELNPEREEGLDQDY